jgi:putative hydrolase of the HAD superfamily
MIRVVSFDIWGTLLDIEAFFRAISDQIPSHPYDRILEVYKKAIRLRLEGNFSIEKVATESRKYLAKEIEIEDEVLARAIVRALENSKTRELAYQDSLKALSELRKANLKVLALGNVMFWPGIITRHILHMNGILDMFDLTVFSDEIGLQKPSKEIFEYIAKKLDVNIKEIAHIGDSLENDFAGGIIAGVTTFLLNRSFNARVCRIGSEAYVINTLEALPTLIMNLNKK